MLPDLPDAVFHGGCHGLVHAVGIRAFDEIGRPPVTAEEVLQLFVANAGQKSGIINLVAVQVQDGQHRAIANGVQKFADVPRSGQRSSFGLSIPDDRGDDQVRVVERRTAGMREHVAQFASFVDRTGSLRRAVTSDTAREGELFEELAQAEFILALFGINFGVGSLEIPWA